MHAYYIDFILLILSLTTVLLFSQPYLPECLDMGTFNFNPLNWAVLFLCYDSFYILSQSFCYVWDMLYNIM